MKPGDAKPEPGSKFQLSPELIHVWHADCPAGADRCRELFAILDDDEKLRANRLRSDRHRIRFIACRAWLRFLLAAYMGAVPEAIEFDYGRFGKPRLKLKPANQGLVFNVSHTSTKMIFGFALDCMLGVDVERLRELDRLEGLSERICSETEYRQWRKLPGSARPQAFFKIWVRKEAIIKAHGQGISLGMQECEFDLRDLSRPVGLPATCGNPQGWRVAELNCGDDYQAVVAVNRSIGNLVLNKLPEDSLYKLYLPAAVG